VHCWHACVAQTASAAAWGTALPGVELLNLELVKAPPCQAYKSRADGQHVRLVAGNASAASCGEWSTRLLQISQAHHSTQTSTLVSWSTPLRECRGRCHWCCAAQPCYPGRAMHLYAVRDTDTVLICLICSTSARHSPATSSPD